MKSKLRTAMSKMSVRDLGRLYLKDAVALLVDGTAAYTTDEFSSALSRMDDRRRSMCQFMEYRHAASQLCLLTVFSRWVSTAIHEGILRIEAMMGYVSLSGVSYAASQLMVIERLSLDIHDPWDSEVILKEHSADVKEAILARKADIAEACSDLNTLIRMHLTITQAMVSLAEMLQMPEIASIPNNPMG